MVDDNFAQVPLTITNILTLRYDPTQKPLLPMLSWTDFIPTNSKPSLEFIEESIKNQIPKKVSNVSIALSGGVDSALSLTMLRHV